jgi:hypothetical protein
LDNIRFFLLLFERLVKVVLSGVPTDTSEPSGLEIEIFRVFKLIEDLFFFSTLGFSFGPGDRPSPPKPSVGAGVVGVGITSLADGLSGAFLGEDCVINV